MNRGNPEGLHNSNRKIIIRKYNINVHHCVRKKKRTGRGERRNGSGKNKQGRTPVNLV